MRVWRPKRKKSETEDLIAQAEALAPHRPQEDVRRMRISRVRMLAALPPVVALAFVALLPFLLAEPAAPPGGISTPGPGGGPGPADPPPGTRPIPGDPTLPDTQRPVGTPPGPGPGPGPGPSPGEDLEPATRALLDASLRYEQRTGAADQLGRSSDPGALDTLLRAALDRDSSTRALAARGLARKLPDPRATTALSQLLEDPAAAVAEVASAELAKVDRSRELLVGRLARNDPADQVHLNCIRGLIYQGRAEDVPLLMRWVREDGPVGEAATEAVWAICQRTGAPPPPGLPKRLR